MWYGENVGKEKRKMMRYEGRKTNGDAKERNEGDQEMKEKKESKENSIRRKKRNERKRI